MSEHNRLAAYQFGIFRVDKLKRQLYRDGVSIQITSKSFDTLIHLLERAGETVSKADLMDAIWPETAVEENNLTQQISVLRKVFGERAGDHKFIVTVPGRGYCFVANVTKIDEVDDNIAAARPENVSLRSPSSNSFRSNALFGYALALAYVLVICVPAFVVSWQAESCGLRPQSIAIMRFRSAGVGDELLGMGIRDTLRAKLGSLDDVTVRPSDVAATDDIVAAGKQMDADVVVTGSIQHDEDRIRVAVEMVDVSSQRIVWGNTFDNDSTNSFELQDSITNAVLSVLKRPRSSGALHMFEPVKKDGGTAAVYLRASIPYALRQSVYNAVLS